LRREVLEIPEEYGDYSGKYTLQEITGGEKLDLEEKYSEGGVLVNTKGYTLELLQKCLIEPKLTLSQIRTLPASLLDLLARKAMDLNHWPEEKKRGLSRKS